MSPGPRRWSGLAKTSCLLGLFLLVAACASTPRVRDAGPRAARLAVSVALHERGARYRYGGDSPRTGFDCSGLVDYSYARAGVFLPRTTGGLARIGRPVSRWHLKPGDLVFFREGGDADGHVGLYLGHHRFIHAPARGQRVRIDSLFAPYWRTHWTGARRLW